MSNVYCNILPNATNTCASNKEKATANVHANPSVFLWPMAIADEATRRGFTLGDRRGILERIITFSNKIKYTLPLECVSPEEQQEILETTLNYEKALVPEFFESPLGEQELRKGFEEALKENKLCSVNTTHVFEDEQWLNFFSVEKVVRT